MVKIVKDVVQFEISASLTKGNAEQSVADKASWQHLMRRVRDLCADPKYDDIKPDFS